MLPNNYLSAAQITGCYRTRLFMCTAPTVTRCLRPICCCYVAHIAPRPATFASIMQSYRYIIFALLVFFSARQDRITQSAYTVGRRRHACVVRVLCCCLAVLLRTQETPVCTVKTNIMSSFWLPCYRKQNFLCKSAQIANEEKKEKNASQRRRLFAKHSN